MASREPSGTVNKRSRAVCFRCHGKKVRCDLQQQSRGAPCSACADNGAVCVLRPSRKGRPGRRQPPSHRDTRTPQRGDSADAVEAYLGDTSLLGVSTQDQGADHDQSEPSPAHFHDTDSTDRASMAVLQGHLESYLEYCYPWCPVLHPDPVRAMAQVEGSTLLQHALALVGAGLRRPLLPDATPREHYARARDLFFQSATHASPLARIIASMLFYWWSSGPWTVIGLDGGFWWTGVAIRLAQSIGLHREPGDRVTGTADRRRLIWCTLYARDRVTAICQGRPCVIDEDYCDVRPPQVTDFPPDKLREAQIFVGWVQLSSILGTMNEQLFLSRRSSVQFPKEDISNRLIAWMWSLPPALRLPLATVHSIPFDRNVHILHLPYLAMITMMYFKRSGSESDLPEALDAAVVAAACTSRIFEDFLARGSLDFLWGEAGWFVAIAALALLHVLPLPKFSQHAAASVRVLRAALRHMATTRHSAKMFHDGIETILRTKGLQSHVERTHPAGHTTRTSNTTSDIGTLNAYDSVPWCDLFPFVTADTSPLIADILQDRNNTSPEATTPLLELGGQLDEFWDDLLAVTDYQERLTPDWL